MPASATGYTLTRAKLRLIYGGGKVGLMGTLADEVLWAGGQVTGIIPRALWEREIAHEGLTDLQVVEDMQERKKLMAELSDGFIALPGGAGTLEEIFEQWTWSRLSCSFRTTAATGRRNHVRQGPRGVSMPNLALC
jgi:uncharacterized protein (TIGR00730 family)